ncbi:UPF0158 family protein [Sediminibacillus sp. JSM 1682029]|uniref:UPF0158 family protein n=1 Tax=Sediminibacillus sp. JSM 1682029 TaxID=3229857 RepID=UPI003525D205
MRVKLSDIVEEMDIPTEEGNSFLNLETGEFVYVSNGALRRAEDGEEYGHLPDWQQEEMEIAEDLVEAEDKYVPVPDQFDFNEYDIMEDFCYRQPEHTRGKLLSVIKGRGAFRRFKDTIIDFDIRNEWFEFRDQAYREIAKEFCEKHNIEYID